jgi:hypothetical protein
MKKAKRDALKAAERRLTTARQMARRFHGTANQTVAQRVLAREQAAVQAVRRKK